MLFGIAVRERYSKNIVDGQLFRFQSMTDASRFHGDYWNRHFASNDRFCSTMSMLDEKSGRWHRVEIIGWR
jgi:hypothetical protein